MIEIICNDQTYTYNAYHIVKAFYPSEELTSKVEEKASNYVTAVFENGEKIEVPSTLCAGGKEGKEEIDRYFYKKLSEKSGRELAWGMLTGVRPTKIAMKKLEEGWKPSQFVPWLMETCMVSREKAILSWMVANKEQEQLEPLDQENGYRLYVGIPFCPSVCSYCSSSSGPISQWKKHVESYMDALCKELEFIGKASKGKKLNTIYIGGGTPTSISAEQLDRLLTCIDENFSREHLLEYTVEAGRPDSITREKLEVIYKHHVTRISINPQTMQQKTLDLVGRKHTVEDVENIYQMAREIGFDNINMDLIAGLPEETPEDMQDTLSKIAALAPDSLTVHSLAIKRAAKMGQEKKNAVVGEYLSQMIQDASDAARDMGLVPYYLYRQKNIAGNFENVGYAKVDKAGIYNILIMEEKQSIVAAGAGATTKIVMKEPVEYPAGSGKKTHLVRIENVKAIDAYINRIDEMIERKGEWLWR